ncbi:MAG: hypothetical protein HY299_01015 [Verrucomicrobia bacterium]|nr:hypothetical protein [Verrucomicrobiota bacterium]
MTTERTEYSLRLRVICKAPPDPDEHGAEFGVQDNTTTKDWVIHSCQRRENGDFVFECECKARRGTGGNRAPNFLGSFTHGSPAERFLYLSWRPKGWRPGQADPACLAWVRRIKVHLRSITWEQVEAASRSGGVLEAQVHGKARDGGPNCASVPLLGGGWRIP